MIPKPASRIILLALFGCGVAVCASLYDDDYSIGELDDYQIVEKGYDYEDELSDKTWFNPYTGDYDDPYGDVLDDVVTTETDDCQIAADGKPTFSGSIPCDIQIEGVDSAAPALQGGLDGVYKVSTCENGRPLYRRETTEKAFERVMWYSAPHRDWDITNGSSPQEDDILMWGGFGGREARPQQVASNWSLAAEFMPNFTLMSPEYMKISAKVACVAGSQDNDTAVQQKQQGSLLTDEEQDAQYRAVIQQARAKADVNGGLNSGLIFLFVLMGLGIVIGLPFFVARNRRMRRAPGDGKGAFISLTNLFSGKDAHSS